MSKTIQVMVVCHRCLKKLRPASQKECLDAIDGRIPHELCEECEIDSAMGWAHPDDPWCPCPEEGCDAWYAERWEVNEHIARDHYGQ